MSGIRAVGVAHDDPWNARTWSGISSCFFGALRDQNVLVDAVSAKPSRAVDVAYKLKNFSANRAKWRFQHSLDVSLFHARTAAGRRAMKELAEPYNSTIQIGAWYDLSSPKTVNASYQDGNLARTLDNPYGVPNISPGRIAKAMEYEKKLYQKLDVIFTMSRWLASSFVRDFGVPESKVHPIGAGSNMPDIDEEISHEQCGLNIVFVGIDFQRKGGAQLLEAFRNVRRELPEATLTIVGPRLLSGLPDGVEWAGFADKRTPEGRALLDKLYRRAAVFVLPSLYEPFGIVLAEAMSYSLPCVASRAWAMPEIVTDGTTGFLCAPGESEALGQRLIELLKDPTLRRDMGRAGYARYRESFRWDVVARRAKEGLEAAGTN